jgi:acetamidase/formamidase
VNDTHVTVFICGDLCSSVDSGFLGSGTAVARRDFLSSRFHYTFGPHAPKLTISSGASLRVICPDSDNELADGTPLRPDQRQHAAGTTLFEGNPLAGPIFVKGAAPGDSIAVRIEAVHLDRRTGQTGLAPAHGLLPSHLLVPPPKVGENAAVPRHLYRWEIDPDGHVARLTNPLGTDPIAVPLSPFVGCIGVCPARGQQISTLYSGPFGGNMDIPLIRPDATLELPVYHEGALLMMGDIHAAQGEGEIIGGAIETSGRIDCTITLQKGRAIDAPRLRDPQQLAAIGVDGELRGAVQQAYAHLIGWLAEEFAMDRFDAYNLVSQVGSLMMGGLTVSPYAVAACCPLAALPARTRKV